MRMYMLLLQTQGDSNISTAQNILSWVSKPTDSAAKALSKLFPFKSTKTTKFDPHSECAATSSHQKNKKFVPKYSSVDVVMLKKYHTRIPKGEYRQELMQAGRIKKVLLTKQMTPAEVKNKILNEFRCNDFTVLECSKGKLSKTTEELTAQLAIARRGALYLCQKHPVSAKCLNEY